MSKWKYKVVGFEVDASWGDVKMDGAEMENVLNELGENGWEVTTSFTTNQLNGLTKNIIYTLKKSLL